MKFPAMLSFHTTIHARAANIAAGPSLDCHGVSVAPLAVPAEALAHPFPVSFEEAYAVLEALERMFIEPDGALVWVSSATEARWQLDGVLYDRNGKLLIVDLKGTCTPTALDQLLRCLGWPATELMFQITQQAIIVSEADFRRMSTA
ncbi:MAG: hypothetical protein SGJ20_00705 [Planctomycetota bacterium]|nr:hypothetical protein [Planctomycetota bacterium]